MASDLQELDRCVEESLDSMDVALLVSVSQIPTYLKHLQQYHTCLGKSLSLRLKEHQLALVLGCTMYNLYH